MPARRVGRSVVAYWLLGLCNNYGYVVMLSAAHDMLNRLDVISDDEAKHTDMTRHCNKLSTGVILLADIIPSLLTKLGAPFFPLWMNVRVFLTILTAILGFVIVGSANSLTMAVIGVACTSFSSGIGESTLLSFTVFFKDKSVMSAWSSGTGGAGFFGSMTYAALTAVGLSPRTTLYSLVIVPALMSISYWVILENPFKNNVDGQIAEISSSSIEVPENISELSFLARMKKIPPALKYLIPLALVYFFEYLINQGLSELSLVKNSFIDLASQYRWYQVCYQIGVFISRSSISLIQINNLWLLAVLQGLNLVFFLFEAIYLFVDNVFIMFAIIVWEGVLGGASYVNTFYKIQVKEKVEDQEVITGLTTIADSAGITLSGFCAIPIHNSICKF